MGGCGGVVGRWGRVCVCAWVACLCVWVGACVQVDVNVWVGARAGWSENRAPFPVFLTCASTRSGMSFKRPYFGEWQNSVLQKWVRRQNCKWLRNGWRMRDEEVTSWGEDKTSNIRKFISVKMSKKSQEKQYFWFKKPTKYRTGFMLLIL